MNNFTVKKMKIEDIRNILSVMKLGEGYFDFIYIEVCFDRDGDFKLIKNDKVVSKSKSLKEVVDRVYGWIHL